MSSPESLVVPVADPEQVVASSSALIQTPTTALISNPASGPSVQAQDQIIKVQKQDGVRAKVVETISSAFNHGSSSEMIAEAIINKHAVLSANDTASAEKQTSLPGTIETANPAPAKKIVREAPKIKTLYVRKPGGTIVRVRRPVTGGTDKPGADKALYEKVSKPTQKATAQTATTAGKISPKEVSKSTQNEVPKGAAPKDASGPSACAAKIPPNQDVKKSTAGKPAKSRGPVKSSLQFSRGLHGLHRYAYKAMGALNPDWDIDDMRDGDIEAGDDSDTDGDSAVDSNGDDISSIYDHEGRSSNDGSQGGNQKSQADQNGTNGNQKTSPASKAAMKEVSELLGQKQHSKVRKKRRGTNSDMKIDEKKIHEKDSKTVEGNPKGIRKMRASFGFSRFVVAIIMILMPLLFIALGILTALINGKNIEERMGRDVHEAITIAVTAWPIMFAALMAQSLKALATYRVERGIRLMTLEQLISSHSVASSIRQPFLLRRFDWVSIALLCLWSLSPLSSQALQRMLSIGNDDASFVDGNYEFASTLVRPLGLTNISISSTDSIYSSALLSDYNTELLPYDNWNNPKVPILEKLTHPDENGWFTVGALPTDNKTLPYSSLLGVNVTQPPRGFASIFSIESSYFVMNCSKIQTATIENIMNKTNIPSGSGNYSQTVWMYISISGNVASGDTGTWVFGSTENQNDNLYDYSICDFKQSFVESLVDCQGLLCGVFRIRRSRKNTKNTLYLQDLNSFTENFASSGSDVNAPNGRTLTEEYLAYGPIKAVQNSILDLSASAHDLIQDLPLLFNTYWQAALDPFIITGSSTNASGNSTFQPTNATVTEFTLVWNTSWGWLSLLFASSTFLLVAGIASTIWESLTVSPDTLGFASTTVRTNRHIKVPPYPKGTTVVGGAARANQLADLRVMLQDLSSEKKVGRIVLGTVEEGSKRLEKGRIYR